MGKQWKTVRDFIFLVSKITADGDCSHEIKRCLFLGRKAMANLDSIFKSRDITLLTKVCLLKAMLFFSSHAWMWELDHKESWAPKKWCFWTFVVWRRLLSNPWAARREKQSILKEINPEYTHWKDWCWNWSSNTLGTWCEDLTHLKRPWCWERLKAGRKGDDRGWNGWIASPTQWIWVWVSSRSWWRTGKPGMLQSMGSQRIRFDWSTEQQ